MFKSPFFLIMENEEPEPITKEFNILDKFENPVGYVELELYEEDKHIEITGFQVAEGENMLEVARTVINQIWRAFEDYHRIYTKARGGIADLWRKNGFKRLKGDYYYRDRGH